MARRKRLTYRRRRRNSWSTRIFNFSGAQSVAQQQQYVIYYNLCQNPAQTNDTISQKYTVKNIDVSVELEPEGLTAQAYINNLQFFVCFIPQGYIPTGVPSAYAGVPFDHPEWIMAHRYVGSPVHPSDPGYAPLRVRSRLSRNLDTGDRVVLIILGTNTTTQSNSYTINYRGLVKFNTKAN